MEATEENQDSAQADSDDDIEVKPHKRQRGKRSPLPADLPRERVEHDLSDEEKVCSIHNTLMERIGENVTENLEIVPAKAKVIENVTFSYKCPCCSKENLQDEIIKSNKEPAIIPKGIATSSLLAYIAVAKYADALPLYRQENIFSRF